MWISRPYSQTFRILASTEAVDARDNTSTTDRPGFPIYWLNGAKVADDYADFYDGSWDEEVTGRRETGVAVTIGSSWEIWTGSAHDGTEFFDADTTSRAVGRGAVVNPGDPYPVAVGRPNSSTASHGPISGSTADGATSKGVYALSGVFTVATPPVTVELTSTTTTYAIGDAVEATATFSEAVDITGTPQLELDFAGTPKAAACTAAMNTNTTTMVCSYTVVENDLAPNGIAIAANKLTLNGGTITATSTTDNADLDHVALAIDAAHKVDGFRPLFVITGNDAPTTSTDGTQVILTFTEDISSVDRTRITIVLGTDTLSTSAASAAGTTVELALTTALTATTTNLTVALSADAVEDAAGNGNLAVPAVSVTNTVVTAPTVTSVELTSTATTTTYAIGDEVEATVTFSAGVDITGTPQLELDFAGTPKPAACTAATNTTTMVCSYTVVMGDTAPNGIAIAANKLTLNGGTITATGSTTNTAVLAHAAVAIDAAHKVDGIRPTLVTTGADAPTTSTDGTQVILTFSEDIGDVDGTQITIVLGTDTLSTSAASAAGTTVELALTTALTATTTNLTVALSADAVEDAAGNGNLAVPATSVTNTVGVTTAPTVTSVVLTSTATTTTYAIGDEVEATVTFSAGVDITGTPQLELDFAGTPKPAACDGRHDTTTMLCSYTVVMGDSAPNGIAIAANKLTLNGGTITATGSTTNNAVLAHAAVAIDAAHAVANTVTNAPPAFQATSTTREVAENSAAGTNVGDPVTATDSGDTLTYTLEGPDAASFDIVLTSGQIRTKSGVTYDYETKSSYAVIVKAEDRNGGSATIAVTITVVTPRRPSRRRARRARWPRTAPRARTSETPSPPPQRRHADLHPGRPGRGLFRYRLDERADPDQVGCDLRLRDEVELRGGREGRGPQRRQRHHRR